MSRKAYTNKTVSMELKMRSRKDKTRKVCSQSQKKMKISGIESQHGKEDVAGVEEGKKGCASRESNPGQLLGRQLCYHYTTSAVKMLLQTSFASTPFAKFLYI